MGPRNHRNRLVHVLPVPAATQELVIGHWGGADPTVIRTAILPDLQAKYPSAKLFS